MSGGARRPRCGPKSRSGRTGRVAEPLDRRDGLLRRRAVPVPRILPDAEILRPREVEVQEDATREDGDEGDEEHHHVGVVAGARAVGPVAGLGLLHLVFVPYFRFRLRHGRLSVCAGTGSGILLLLGSRRNLGADPPFKSSYFTSQAVTARRSRRWPAAPRRPSSGVPPGGAGRTGRSARG